MQRLASIPRSNWQATVESQGFHFHTLEGQPYWDESAYYQFTSAQIDELERATYDLDRMCLEAVPHVIDDIGWNEARRMFVDLREQPIREIFKLYPWEWLLRETFASHLIWHPTRWLEPPWKMILSNKAILTILWEIFPNSPYLLPAFLQPFGNSFVKKPALSREGANIAMVVDGRTELETGGDYGGPFVYQAIHKLPAFDGNYPVIGSWMVNGYACGIGILLMVLGYKTFDWITPKLDVQKELAENHNIAVAIVIAAVLIGVSLLVAHIVAA